MKMVSMALLAITLGGILGCRKQDVVMWGNAEVGDAPQGCHASYYVVGSKDGEPHVALVVVRTPEIPAPRGSASLSTRAITVSGNAQPLPDEFVVFANTPLGEIRSFPGNERMGEILRRDHSATATELIGIAVELSRKSGLDKGANPIGQ